MAVSFDVSFIMSTMSYQASIAGVQLSSRNEGLRVLSIGSSATRAGAPRAHLAIARQLSADGWSVSLALIAGGPLFDEFRKVTGNVIIPPARPFDNVQLPPIAIRRFNHWAMSVWRKKVLEAAQECDVIHVNSAAVFKHLPLGIDAPLVAHIHEMNYALDQHLDRRHLSRLATEPRRFIAASDAVRESLISHVGAEPGAINVVNEPMTLGDSLPQPRTDFACVRVLGMGSIEWRKGIDFFLQVALRVQQYSDRVRFVWLGSPIDLADRARIDFDMAKMGLAAAVHVISEVPDVSSWLVSSSIVLIPSREDPYPLAAVEACATGRPYICFEGSGGAVELARESGCGLTVPYGDVVAMADATIQLLDDAERRESMGVQGRAYVTEHNDIATITRQIELTLEAAVAR